MVNLTYSVPYFVISQSSYVKQMYKPAIIEALINIIISIILVNFLNITGVLIGTLASCVIRPIFYNYYVECRIFKRKFVKTLFLYLGNFSLYFIAMIVYFIFPLKIENFIFFFIVATIVTMIILIIFALFNIIYNREIYFFVKKIIKEKFKRKEKNF